jgi:hypothetical protein
LDAACDAPGAAASEDEALEALPLGGSGFRAASAIEMPAKHKSKCWC